MSDKSEIKKVKDRTTFSREVGTKAARKLKSQGHSARGVWFGLGMMGLIGWWWFRRCWAQRSVYGWTITIQEAIPGR